MPFKNQIINEDATVISKLEEAGGVLVAKMTMGALAWGDVWFGGLTRRSLGYHSRIQRFISWFCLGCVGWFNSICNRYRDLWIHSVTFNCMRCNGSQTYIWTCKQDRCNDFELDYGQNWYYMQDNRRSGNYL